ncbi:NAD(P)H-dependent oxidoreductase [Halovivax sp.]|uniref:NAD(P)H-dependent oxidoreductase n=1 Tax=Halovivax sp. TaxID=1935978 RepID=UPI0025B95EA8|nr:NAD(P)H-dependent oxidoreductase [Halovivax sp.]
MRALVVLAHPRTDSLCGDLARAYRDGALEAGVDVRFLALADLEFDHDVRTECSSAQPLEDDLAEAESLIRWADHLVFVYPNWWGTMPALLKGFFDRVFRPGFAFEFYEEGEGAGRRELLDDTTAELLVTMDVPPWVYRWIQRAPGTNAVKGATLGFAGIRTTRTTYFGSVEDSSLDERRTWLSRAADLGRGLENGPESRTRRIARQARTAVGALRLQFYPMAWVAYAVGALAATGSTAALSSAVFWAGFGFLLFLEAATVLSNELADYETDRRNAFAGPFTGGSRVLVDDELDSRALLAGATAAGVAAVAFGLAVLGLAGGSTVPAALLLVGLSALALGYTLPPLRLSYRTLGELDVAATHSLLVVLCGYVFLGGDATNPLPWLLGAPMLLSVLPSITMAGVPDRRADRAAGKETIAARFGFDGAAAVAAGTAVAAAAVAVGLHLSGAVTAYGPLIYLTVPHALVIAWLVRDRVRGLDAPRRIDGVMIASLTFIAWFGVVPLVELA